MIKATDEQVRKILGELGDKWMPNELGEKFLKSMFDFYGKWVANAARYGEDMEGEEGVIPMGVYPLIVGIATGAHIESLALMLDVPPTAFAITLLEGVVKSAMQSKHVDMGAYALSEPVKFLTGAKMLADVKEAERASGEERSDEEKE
jgi:hypothetical protein